VLREAGVVDAGGYGLTIIFAGVIAALRGAEPPPLEHHAPARITHPQHASSTYRFCTNFAVVGEELEPSAWVKPLERLGDSVLVVGEGTMLRVHVHTDDPEAAIAVFREGGTEVSHLDVADMHEQVRERNERLARPVQRCIALAVVSSAGMRELFEGIGAVTLDGGPTLNPSTYELLAGIHEVPAEEVVVLPNSPNVVMAAERAAELSEKDVRVVKSRSMQAGLAAAVAMDPGKPCSVNAPAREEALAHVRTGAVTGAARDDAVEATPRFRVGDAVGFVDEELVAWGDVAKTLETVLAELSREAELVTLIEGDGAPLAGDEVAGLAPAGVELEYERGGQPAYWWLIAAE
jgi:dihydroxyacetone kinase-like predicted kinase